MIWILILVNYSLEMIEFIRLMHHKSDHVHTIAHAESGSLSYITLLRTRTNLRRCLLFEPVGFIHLWYLMYFKLWFLCSIKMVFILKINFQIKFLKIGIMPEIATLFYSISYWSRVWYISKKPWNFKKNCHICVGTILSSLLPI